MFEDDFKLLDLLINILRLLITTFPPYLKTLETLVCKLNALMKESESVVTESGQTVCHPMDRSLPGCSVGGTFQARIPGWVAIP